MEGAEENEERLDLSLHTNGLSRDLLHKFIKQSHYPNQNEQKLEEDEIELSLGLSMNGRFGVDPSRKKHKRSCSISNLVSEAGGSVDNGGSQEARGVALDSYASLTRTQSLPTVTEEEWRRRKELQSMRRMEARRKRMGKLKNVRLGKDKENCSASESTNNGSGLCDAVNGCGNNVRGLDIGVRNGFENGSEIESSRGSIGLPRSGSSGISDVQSQQMEGPKRNGEIKSPPNLPCSQVKPEPEPSVGAADRHANGASGSLKSAMPDMPYVTTKGDGPNGKKVEGFLYRYKKGEEVRIVCVCHGMFLSPAEFIKHGGGGDVEHPLKHIVVNPFPLL